MNIFHYRKNDYVADPWQEVLITGKTDLGGLKSRAIVSINGQTVLRQHSVTYITGRDTCHAHHFAKMLAAAVLSGSYDRAPGLSVNLENIQQGSVLWIDSVNRIHACADFFNEMISAFDPNHERFSLMSLDKLGSFRYDYYSIVEAFERAVRNLKPELVVIDDIDHLMPNCGVNVAAAFNHAIRDVLNHTETACLFIGYNHLGKRASTTGHLGAALFPEAYNIFSVTTQQAITTVKLIKSFNAPNAFKAQFHFTIDSDNLPQEVIKTFAEPQDSSYMQQCTLRDIIGDVIKPGETISPDDLFDKINSRRQQLNRYDRTRNLIAQAAQFGIIQKAANDSNDYTLSPGSPCRDLVTAPSTPAVNNSLTFPPHPSSNESTPSTPSNQSSQPSPSGQPSSPCRGSATAPSSPSSPSCQPSPPCRDSVTAPSSPSS